MDIPPRPQNEPKTMPIREHIPKRILFTLSVAVLEERCKQLALSMQLTCNEISRYAEVAPYSEEQTKHVQNLEEKFKGEWRALEAATEAIISYAEIAEWVENQFDRLAHVTSEGVGCLLAITSGEAITAEWLARRDLFIAQAYRLIDSDWIGTITTASSEKGTTPP